MASRTHGTRHIDPQIIFEIAVYTIKTLLSGIWRKWYQTHWFSLHIRNITYNIQNIGMRYGTDIPGNNQWSMMFTSCRSSELVKVVCFHAFQGWIHAFQGRNLKFFVFFHFKGTMGACHAAVLQWSKLSIFMPFKGLDSQDFIYFVTFKHFCLCPNGQREQVMQQLCTGKSCLFSCLSRGCILKLLFTFSVLNIVVHV